MTAGELRRGAYRRAKRDPSSLRLPAGRLLGMTRDESAERKRETESRDGIALHFFSVDVLKENLLIKSWASSLSRGSKTTTAGLPEWRSASKMSLARK